MSTENKRRMLNHQFHVNLSDKFDGEDYWLQVENEEIPLLQHSAETLREAHLKQPLLQSMPEGELTHYTSVPIPMPLGSVMRISVRHSNKTGMVPGAYGVNLVAIHSVPDDEQHQLLCAENTLKVVAEPIDYLSTAKSLLFHHADLISSNEEVKSVVFEHMSQEKSPDTFLLIQKMAKAMRLAGPPTSVKDKGWANYEEFDAGDQGKHQTLVPTNATMSIAGDPMTAIQISTKNDLRLKNKNWSQESGTSVQTDHTTTRLMETPELLASLATDENGNNWKAALSNTNASNGLQTSIFDIDSDNRKLRIHMENTYLRWLGVYVQFIDADGKAMDTPTWQPDDGGIAVDIANALGVNYDSMRFIGWIDPINTFMAIPIYSDPGVLDVKITFPQGAVSANIYGCGLGTGNNQYPKTPVVGGVLTGLANLGIPAFMLGFGVAAQSYAGLYKAMGNPTFVKAVVAIGVIYFGAKFTHTGAVNKKMDWKAFSSLSQILFSKGATAALVWCEKEVAGGVLTTQIPFAGWIVLALNIATGIAQIATTIVQVATSPWMIPNSLSTTITSTLTVFPDPRRKGFPSPPPGAKPSYITRMIYQQENRPTVTSPSVALDSANYPKTLTATFINTLGGKVKFEVDFYLDSWLAGKATTAWMDNNADNTSEITLYLFQQPIPLDSKSIYKHKAILGYKDNVYKWMDQSTPPNATIANTDTSQSGNAISTWMGLALSQRSGMIGLSWKAAGMGIVDCSTGAGGQLYGFQNLNIPGTEMDAVKFPGCGFSAPSQLVYDVFPAKFLMRNGNFVLDGRGIPKPDPSDKSLGNYYIDPRKANNSEDTDGGYHLRKVTLDTTTPFNMDSNQKTYGRFPYFPDSIAMHPTGQVVGVNRQFHKMMVTTLAPEPGLADDNIPLALTFAGQALNFDGSDGRAGLLFTPVAVCCSYAGTILVLEQLRSQGYSISRVQAFDLNGNPVSCFLDAAGKESPFLTLPSDVTYLDITAVGDNFTTYLYVLSYTGSGNKTTDYNMNLYKYGKDAPKGNLLVVTPNIPAAKLNVDMWHTIYTLNYQMTQDGNGNNAGPKGGTGTGPAGRTVPSVSEWLPPLPEQE